MDIRSTLSIILALAELVVFHAPDGREVAVNPTHVTSLQGRSVDGSTNKLFVDSVHCVIGLTDGKFLTVAENCEEVKRKLEEAK